MVYRGSRGRFESRRNNNLEKITALRLEMADLASLYAWAGTIYGGSSEILRNVIAKDVLHLPV